MRRTIAVIAGAGIVTVLVGVVLELGQGAPPRTCSPAPVASIAKALGAGAPAPHDVVFSGSVRAAEAHDKLRPAITGAEVLNVVRSGAATTAQVELSATGPYGTYAIPENLTLACSKTKWVLNG